LLLLLGYSQAVNGKNDVVKIVKRSD